MGCVLTALAAPLAGLLRRLILYFQSLDRLPDRNDSDNASVVTAWSSSDSSFDDADMLGIGLGEGKGKGKGNAKDKGHGKGKAPSQVFAPAWLWMDMEEIH